MTKLILGVLALVLCHSVLAEQSETYLPLAVGNKWVLKGKHRKPIIFEVVSKDDNGFVVQSTTPWSATRWTLKEDGDKLRMTAYGNTASGPMMPLPDSPMYLDFTREAGEKWTNALGTLGVTSRSATVESKGQTYSNCMQIEHKAGRTKLWSSFAKGIGYVQFGHGKSAFVLDESASTLPKRLEPAPGDESAPGLLKREPPVSQAADKPSQ